MITDDNCEKKLRLAFTWKMAFGGGVLGCIPLGIVCFVKSNAVWGSIFLVAGIVCAFLTVYYFFKEKRIKKYKLEREAYKKAYDESLNAAINELGLTYRGYIGDMGIFLDNDRIFFLEEPQYNVMVDYQDKSDIYNEKAIECINNESIILNDIVFYSKEGDIQYTTGVAGGGSNVSVGGAIVGGLVAGGVGMLIGGKGVDQVYSYDIEHDMRETFIRYNVNGKTMERRFPYFVVHDILFDVIPEKDLLNINTTNTVENNITEVGVEERLRKLKSLLENNMITEEEYKEKKKKIIDSI